MGKKSTIILASIITVFGIVPLTEAQAMPTEGLNAKQEQIVTIAAFTANGDLQRLKTALSGGLDAGLTINEIKEILVQMYAYAGFPRSLNGINTFIDVLEERNRKGGKDVPGKEPSPLAANRNSIERGTEIQTRLIGAPATGKYITFAPAIDAFLKGHLFGDIFGRDNLDFQSRELATISALVSIDGATPQLQAHFNVGLNIGLTEVQLRSLISVLDAKVGKKQAANANETLSKVLSNRPAEQKIDITRSGSLSSNLGSARHFKPLQHNNNRGKDITMSTNNLSQSVIFPVGEKLDSDKFKGTVWLNMLTPFGSALPIGNVTFEPGCRNNWHKHAGGQVLLVTGGRGYYQEWGKPAQELHAGDVVNIPANVKHWHGAAKDSWFVHLAIEVHPEKGPATWLEPVSDEDYNKLP